MPAIPDTVGVKCPRCAELVACTLTAEPVPAKPGTKPGRNVTLTVPDLADRLADHYQAAHPAQAAAATGRPHVDVRVEAAKAAITEAGRKAGEQMAKMLDAERRHEAAETISTVQEVGKCGGQPAERPEATHA